MDYPASAQLLFAAGAGHDVSAEPHSLLHRRCRQTNQDTPNEWLGTCRFDTSGRFHGVQ